MTTSSSAPPSPTWRRDLCWPGSPQQRSFDNVGLIFRNDLWGQWPWPRRLRRRLGWLRSLSVAVEPGQTELRRRGARIRRRRRAGSGPDRFRVAKPRPSSERRWPVGHLRPVRLQRRSQEHFALIEAVGAAALAGMYGAGTADPPDSASSAAWTTAWIEAYSEPPKGSYVREVYDATIALALAAQAANSIDGGAIRDQLRTIGVAPGQPVIAGPEGVAQALEALADGGHVIYQGASGTLDWNANGDLRSRPRRHLALHGGRADRRRGGRSVPQLTSRNGPNACPAWLVSGCVHKMPTARELRRRIGRGCSATTARLTSAAARQAS